MSLGFKQAANFNHPDKRCMRDPPLNPDLQPAWLFLTYVVLRPLCKWPESNACGFALQVNSDLVHLSLMAKGTLCVWIHRRGRRQNGFWWVGHASRLLKHTVQGRRMISFFWFRSHDQKIRHNTTHWHRRPRVHSYKKTLVALLWRLLPFQLEL